MITFPTTKKVLLISVYIALCGLFCKPAQADNVSGTVYYSIHVASFIQLQNANRFVNSLKTRGKAVFWKETDVPGKGMYYRVYLGKYTDKDEAAAFWNQLKQEGAVSYFGVHAFTEPEKPKPHEVPAVEIPAAALEKKDKTSKKIQSESLPRPQGRFVDHGDGTVTDTRTGLMWVKNGWRMDFFSALKWEEARDRCSEFSLAGHNDWRLPSIKEWMGLIDRNRQYPAVVSPNPFENIIAHMPYWSGTEYRYKINSPLGRRVPLETYTVMLYAGTVHHQKKTGRAFVMPVRSPR